MSGSWSIDNGVHRRWRDSGIGEHFKKYWPDPASTAYNPWNDSEARPKTPLPFVVYEKGVSVKQGESTGSQCEQTVKVEYWRVPITFRIHAATPKPDRVGYGLTGKQIAEELAKLIVATYQDSAGRLDLDDDDRHIQTHIGEDHHVREDDDVWLWIIQLDIDLERRRTMRLAGQ